MPIYRIDDNQIVPIERSTFAKEGLRERQDLQNMLKNKIDVISPDTLVVAEEFCDWEGSRRSIDLLGIDKNANLIVIELKRTEDGGHMELQAIRYASMISTLTFDKLVAIYTRYLNKSSSELDATQSLLNFLEWDEPDEDQFAQEVRIVLASAEFSKEITTSVMWLNDFGLDIRCVRMHPYNHNGEALLDVQMVIPIPENADYQIRIRDKKQRERVSRINTRDLTKYDISIAGDEFHAQNKRNTMLHIISGVLNNEGTPDEIIKALPSIGNRLFKVFEGNLDSKEFCDIIMMEDTGGKHPISKRYFIGDSELFHIHGKTYALTNQWGSGIIEAIGSLAEKFPDLRIEIKAAKIV